MLTKTTHNMARRRGVGLVEYLENDQHTIEIAALDVDGQPHDEYDARYVECTTTYGWVFAGSCFRDVEEWPYWIESETHLRRLLDAMAIELAS